MKKILYDILFPRRCIICDDLVELGAMPLHPKCQKLLFPVTGAVCMHCGRPLVSEAHEFCYDCAKRTMQGKIAAQGKIAMQGKCVEETFLQGKSLFLYKGEIKQTMYRFKYSNKREYATFFAQAALNTYGKWLNAIDVDAIIPVPMYKKKERSRGYNQAAVFAKELEEEWKLWDKNQENKLPICDTAVIQRIKNTRPMKELGDIERKNNLKNAFQTTENIVKYKKILLVDDIYTTGSTADAVTKALLAAGVREVYFLSICIGKGV